MILKVRLIFISGRWIKEALLLPSYHVASTSSRWGALISGCVYGGQKGRDLLFCICMQLLKNGGVNRDAATKTAECISYAL
jgi:hypothetical protein